MTVAVIGGGASGMMAAKAASEKGSTVYLLEKQARVGRKLLATGNGRCNLSNMALSPEHYHGYEAGFAVPALNAFGTEQTLDFFLSLGLITVTEPSGKIYPFSDSAASVLDVLRFSVQEAGVIVETDFEVSAIEREGRGFIIKSSSESVKCDKVIVCCGGMAGGKLGGSKNGYELLKSMGHSVTKLYPALVQIKTDNTFVKSLKGVRADASVTLMRRGIAIDRSEGEVQFTEYGVSGPAIFEISRSASTAKNDLTLRLDLMRPLTAAQLAELIENRAHTMPSLTMDDLLTGILQNRLGRTVLRYCEYDLNASVSALKAKDARRIAEAVKCFTLPVIDTLGFDSAQVTAGGVKTSEFNPETMESRLVPGLYAAGEVLDIDGDCGGYNLQWAWASGYLAGQTL